MKSKGFKAMVAFVATLALTLGLVPVAPIQVQPAEAYDSNWLEDQGFYYVIDPDGTAAIVGTTDATNKLTDLVIPESLGGKTVTRIDGGGIASAYSAVTVTIPSGVDKFGSYTTSWAGEASCNLRSPQKLREYVVDAGNSAFRAAGGVLYTMDYSYLVSYPSKKENETFSMPEGVAYFGMNCFSGIPNRSVTSVVLPSTFKDIEGSYYLNTLLNLNAIEVAAGNNIFCALDGVLYSADKSQLVLYPGGRIGNYFEIPAWSKDSC